MLVVGDELLEHAEGIRKEIDLKHSNPFLYLADTNTLNIYGDAPEGYVNLAQEVSRCPSARPTLSNPVVMGDTVVYLYTSGTTGLPKAAPGSHRKFIRAYGGLDRKSTRLNSSHVRISYAVFCLKKK